MHYVQQQQRHPVRVFNGPIYTYHAGRCISSKIFFCSLKHIFAHTSTHVSYTENPKTCTRGRKHYYGVASQDRTGGRVSFKGLAPRALINHSVTLNDGSQPRKTQGYTALGFGKNGLVLYNAVNHYVTTVSWG